MIVPGSFAVHIFPRIAVNVSSSTHQFMNVEALVHKSIDKEGRGRVILVYA